MDKGIKKNHFLGYVKYTHTAAQTQTLSDMRRERDTHESLVA